MLSVRIACQSFISISVTKWGLVLLSYSCSATTLLFVDGHFAFATSFSIRSKPSEWRQISAKCSRPSIWMMLPQDPESTVAVSKEDPVDLQERQWARRVQNVVSWKFPPLYSIAEQRIKRGWRLRRTVWETVSAYLPPPPPCWICFYFQALLRCGLLVCWFVSNLSPEASVTFKVSVRGTPLFTVLACFWFACRVQVRTILLGIGQFRSFERWNNSF